MKLETKRKFIVLILVVCLLSLSACRPTEETPQKKEFLVVYHVDEGAGTIIGESAQWVEQGKNATSVTVVPALGYRFVRWQDNGSENPTRLDCDIQDVLFAHAVMQGPYELELKYKAGNGGTLSGDTHQWVLLGGDGAAVSAVPDEGYRFVQWSDGVTDAVRIDKSVQESLLGDSFSGVYAEFERYERKFEYEYNGATASNSETQVVINLDNLSSLKLPVPERDNCVFEGWYSDFHFTTQVSNDKGEVIADASWLQNEYIHGDNGCDRINRGGKLYAKWRALNTIPTYKILMIYVTEAHAELEGVNGELIQVDYVMSDVEKRICDIITEYMQQYVNAILNAEVQVEVDSYFTTVPVVNFNRGSVSLDGVTSRYEYDLGVIFEREMPEVVDLIKDYQSVLTTFSMNDFNRKLHITAGSAGAKYGSVHFENIQRFIELDDPEDIFNFESSGIYSVWEATMETYVHEFIHTVEMQLGDDYYGLHKALTIHSDKYGRIDTAFDIAHDYLLNYLEINGINVGIPYEFWTGEYFEQ